MSRPGRPGQGSLLDHRHRLAGAGRGGGRVPRLSGHVGRRRRLLLRRASEPGGMGSRHRHTDHRPRYAGADDPRSPRATRARPPTSPRVSRTSFVPRPRSRSVLPAILLPPEAAAFPATNFPSSRSGSARTGSTTCWASIRRPRRAVTGASKSPRRRSSPPPSLNITSRQAAQITGTVGWVLTTLARVDGDPYDAAGFADTVTATTVKGTAASSSCNPRRSRSPAGPRGPSSS